MADLIMGFDFGTSKIGVAVGQKLTASANPIGKFRARDGKPDWSQLDRVIHEWPPSLFVVGLPLNMDDSKNDITRAAERFARRLHGRYEIPFELMDERLSTFEAKQSQTKDVDATAACLILETWLSQV